MMKQITLTKLICQHSGLVKLKIIKNHRDFLTLFFCLDKDIHEIVSFNCFPTFFYSMYLKSFKITTCGKNRIQSTQWDCESMGTLTMLFCNLFG